ncbi:putative membrane protein [Orientia tsutsugamushi str. UT144]|uniref:Putative membrane protein n=1 Tax=Orientia tsutsugamushi str. UT144 TaxID=1441384 RepID=A0A0F3RM22_ORITS|nr:putative membrane protein [Orientia tsutsugamushi str. UT144]
MLVIPWSMKFYFEVVLISLILSLPVFEVKTSTLSQFYFSLVFLFCFLEGFAVNSFVLRSITEQIGIVLF